MRHRRPESGPARLRLPIVGEVAVGDGDAVRPDGQRVDVVNDRLGARADLGGRREQRAVEGRRPVGADIKGRRPDLGQYLLQGEVPRRGRGRMDVPVRRLGARPRTRRWRWCCRRRRSASSPPTLPTWSRGPWSLWSAPSWWERPVRWARRRRCTRRVRRQGCQPRPNAHGSEPPDLLLARARSTHRALEITGALGGPGFSSGAGGERRGYDIAGRGRRGRTPGRSRRAGGATGPRRQ